MEGITFWQMYIWSIWGNIGVLLVISLFVLLGVGFIAFMFRVEAASDKRRYSEGSEGWLQEDKLEQASMRVLIGVGVTMLVVSIILTLMPSKENLALIYFVPKVATTENISDATKEGKLFYKELKDTLSEVRKVALNIDKEEAKPDAK